MERYFVCMYTSISPPHICAHTHACTYTCTHIQHTHTHTLAQCTHTHTHTHSTNHLQGDCVLTVFLRHQHLGSMCTHAQTQWITTDMVIIKYNTTSYYIYKVYLPLTTPPERFSVLSSIESSAQSLIVLFLVCMTENTSNSREPPGGQSGPNSSRTRWE